MRRFLAVALFIAVMPIPLRAGDDDRVALRIRFGMKDRQQTDWSGSLDASSGQVESIRGWRWMTGDSAEGNTWTVSTRRQRPQGRAERQRVRAGQQLPMTPNGIIVTLAGAAPDAQITFDAKPGKHQFKLSDVPYGTALTTLEENLEIQRVPAAMELAGSSDDEDYPAAAIGKDGRLYLAYLSFRHGEDFMGARERPATPESGPHSSVTVQGEVRRIEKPEDFDYLAQPTGGEQIFLRIGRNGGWSEPIAVTDRSLELYRPAVAVDGDGQVWVFYSAHVGADENLDHGNWELMARRFDADGKPAGEPINLSNAPGADFMPAVATDSHGAVHVAWIGGREKRFGVFTAQQQGQEFSAPARLSPSDASAWEPAIAASASGDIAIAWDTYAKGDYDVYCTRRKADGTFGEAQPVAASLGFEVRPSLAFDRDNRLWIAWEFSGDQWGKDWGALKKQGIPIYMSGRSIAVKVQGADGKWFTPPDVMEAMPDPQGGARPRARGRARPAGASGYIAPCFPRLTVGGDGTVWLAFRGRAGGNWRVNVGSVWNEYVTRLDGDAWADAIWVPRSNNILDNRPALIAGADGLLMAYSGDGRGEMNPAKLVDAHPRDAEVSKDTTAPSTRPTAESHGDPRPRRAARGSIGDVNCDLFVAHVRSADFPAVPGKATLAPAEPEQAATPAQDTASERQAIGAMREYRVQLGDETLRIWRGEFHRHTELSPDGGNDGALLDMWRYGIDAADLDWIGDGDHDYGSGREYSWWTTQKCVTLFTLPGRFVPVYAYERSVVYPEGHRNCMFARRGIRSLPRLPLSDPKVEAPAPDTIMLYRYLHHFDGLCASHTSATDMGTDWRNNDPEVEPFVEIYQGERNNYERPDAPRSAVTQAKLKQSTPEKESIGGWRPKGFVNLALKKGYRLAFQASSDHISTHLSYCNVLIPAGVEPTRQAVLDAVRKRRVYGATDNIIVDVRCTASDGKVRFMGEEFSTAQPPTLNIHIVGAQPIAKVTIIKDDEEVHVATPNTQDVTFTWTDPNPTPGKTSYYYVRGEQVVDLEDASSGELVWASPMWINYEPAKE